MCRHTGGYSRADMAKLIVGSFLEFFYIKAAKPLKTRVIKYSET
jgi:hypothetical protein